jgi:hypothetical protein
VQFRKRDEFKKISKEFGGDGRSRTYDTADMSRML